ncbi:UNVERIFIED_CONTAM: Outer envelope pore protein 16-4, chloroplastic [Sesamum calycinum]|uniref:Outer envelope pore protein 16-4, chloroplastic n=1 Tax=Sesamum calycinum TaxID=2727403 RepID=A0AAW2SAV4_9LAMI
MRIREAADSDSDSDSLPAAERKRIRRSTVGSLSGSARASYIAKTVGHCGFSCGIFAAIFTFTHCGMQRYRQKKDWVNTLAAGALAGAAFGAGTRNWKQVAGITGLFCTLFQFAQDSKSV